MDAPVANPAITPHRLADLAACIARSSLEHASWLPAAAAAAEQLARLVPGAGAAVFARTRDPDLLRAVVVENVPKWSSGRRIALRSVPLFVQALGEPDRIAAATAVRATSADPRETNSERVELLCAAVPAAGPPAVLLVLVAPGAPVPRRDLVAALEVARAMLATLVEPAAGRRQRDPSYLAVRRAKREWESTADALPAVLGLVDTRGRVLRINRAIERVSGVQVQGAIGLTLHDAFHGPCEAPSCALAAAFATALEECQASGRAEVEVDDAHSGVVWDLRLLRAGRAAEADEPADPGVAFALTDITRLSAARRALEHANQTLERRVAERASELTSANAALRAEIARRQGAETALQRSQRELQQLADQRVRLQEDERKRIADELHDAVGQSLSAIKYSLERAHEQLARPDLGSVGPLLATSIVALQRLVGDVREISMNLRPSVLDDLGAASAVRWLCREWHTAYASVDVEAHIEVADLEIPRPLALTVFRTVQESLNNVAKHANAAHVDVAVRRHEDHLELQVRDDGLGFDPSDLNRGPSDAHGLRSMRERAERTGGSFRIVSAPGRGTTVAVVWPMTGATAAREGGTCVN